MQTCNFNNIMTTIAIIQAPYVYIVVPNTAKRIQRESGKKRSFAQSVNFTSKVYST